MKNNQNHTVQTF